MKTHDVRQTLAWGVPPEQARGAVILLHGRGASAEDIAGLAGMLPGEGLAFFAPQAFQNTWYPQRFFVPLEQNEPWLSDALALLDGLVDKLHQAGLPHERIGVAGFSQGGCLALEYVARQGRKHGFAAGLSGALIGPLKTPRADVDLQGTPVLIGCAEGDAHIPLPFVEASASWFSRAGAKVEKQVYAGFDHAVFPQEVAWLGARLEEWR